MAAAKKNKVVPLPVKKTNGVHVPVESTLGDEEIKTRVVEVSPEKAAKWLERNHPNNREIAYGRVAGFANDMRDGHWKVTHQGIAFDAEGRLIDGQHRLTAVIQSGATVRMMVVWNVGSFGDPIDCGRPRSLATLAQAPSKVVALVNGLRMLEQGYSDNVPMTLAGFQEVQGHHAEAIEAVRTVAHHTRVTAGILAGFAYAWAIAPEEVIRFATQVCSAEGLVRGEPAFALFNWKTSASARVKTWDMSMATLNAVRSHLSAASLKAVYITESGYRAITAKRRVMKIPHTPATNIVAPGITFDRTKQDKTNPAPTVPRVVMTFEEE